MVGEAGRVVGGTTHAASSSQPVVHALYTAPRTAVSAGCGPLDAQKLDSSAIQDLFLHYSHSTQVRYICLFLYWAARFHCMTIEGKAVILVQLFLWKLFPAEQK